MLTTRLLNEEAGLPLVAEAADGREVPHARLIEWLGGNRATLDEWLQTHGAVLFRGFSVSSATDFGHVAACLGPNLLGYVGGNSPRELVSSHVYTSTSYPAQWSISLHNEMSYMPTWPALVIFGCLTPPAEGGETPILDCRRAYARLDDDLLERFIAKRVKYVHRLHGGRGFGRSWQQVFETDDREAVEAFCRENATEHTWTQDGGLHVSYLRDPVITHPRTGSQVWFCQADQWHVSNFDEATRTAMLEVMGEEQLPHGCYFGDGTPIEEADIKAIQAVCWHEASLFPWRRGDVLVLDNVLVAHGRRPFTPPREVVVAMA